MQGKKYSVFKRLFWVLLICGVLAIFALNAVSETVIDPYAGATKLMLEAERNTDPEAIIALVKAGEDVNARDKIGMTSLMWAARYNPNPDVITTLLDLGANPKIYSYGMMPIDFAKINRELKNTELKFGADAKAVENAGVPVINFARGNKNLINTEAFRLLEEASR